MTWKQNLGYCDCNPGLFKSIKGECIAAEENRLQWKGDFGDCTNNIRKRAIREVTPTDTGATEAPWFGRTVNSWRVTEKCGNDQPDFCLDWFAEFNEDSGVCECIEGYKDSIDGCTPWANGDDAAGQAIMDEILRRLRFIENDGSLSSINQKRLAAFERFFSIMERKALQKARSGCGNRSRNMHGSILDENISMYRAFQTCLAKGDSNHNAIRELVYLYNQWQQAYIWNCPNSGYGNDPQDTTDATGTVCTSVNKKKSFKCRIQYHFDILYSRVFKEKPLEW